MNPALVLINVNTVELGQERVATEMKVFHCTGDRIRWKEINKRIKEQ